VIWSTHIVSDLEAGADQVLLLRSGSLIDAGPVADLLLRHDAGTLEEAYLKAMARDQQDVRD
jgi:ABC-type Na+ transport system ATPase subunit NatA